MLGPGDRIRAHAAELVALAPDVIVGQTTSVIRALRQATSSIPIVIAAVNDPVEQGFVSSLAHPGATCRQLAIKVFFWHTGTLKPKCCPKTPQRKVLRDTECSHSWARRGSCIAPGFLAPDKLHRKSLGERAVGEIVTVTSAPLAYLQHQDVTVAQRVRWLSAAADGA